MHQLACGSVHCRAPRFSRGLRQRLKQAAHDGGWADAYGIRVEGHGDERPEPYSVELASSVFCVVLPGVVLSPSCPSDVFDIRLSLLPQQFAVPQHIMSASWAHSPGSPCCRCSNANFYSSRLSIAFPLLFCATSAYAVPKVGYLQPGRARIPSHTMRD